MNQGQDCPLVLKKMSVLLIVVVMVCIIVASNRRGMAPADSALVIALILDI